jgi:hypothetical protein
MSLRGEGAPASHPARTLAIVVAAVYLAVGIVGFLVTGFDRFAAVTGEKLLGIFELNPLHNIVHIVVGVLGLALARTLAGARTYGWILAVGYGVVFLYGLWAVGNRGGNILSLNWPDNILHLLTVLLGVLIALWPSRAVTRDVRT